MNADIRLHAIRLLSDGHWHSGEDLAQTLGVSRAAVWKRLQGLSEWGLELHAVRGRGYRLAQPLELLDTDAIQQQLPANVRTRLQAINLFPVLDSTNAWLMAQADDSGPRLCLAEYQTGGRGRRGRSWCSPFGANLYLSMSWRFTELPAQFSALGLVIGVALAEALGEMQARDIGLKWPNDVQWQNRKLAGILIEHRGEGGGPARVVIGLGLNLAMTPTQAHDVMQPWVTLAEVLRDKDESMPGRNEICTRVVKALMEALDEFSVQGFLGFAQRWMRHDVTQDRPVCVEHDGQAINGIARGIDSDGALLVETAGRRQRFLSGDLSLRLIPEPA